MNLAECIRLAFESIKANKLRSFLTMLGIIIGIGSVITITTIGNSMQKTLSSTMNSLGGTDTVYAYVSAVPPEDGDYENWDYPEMEESERVTYQDLMQMQADMAGKVDRVILSMYGPNAAVDGDSGTSGVSITGVTADTLKASKLTILEGRDISNGDNDGMRPTVVVSDLFVKYACGGKSPLGQAINLSLDDGMVLKAYCVGVYRYESIKLGGGSRNSPEKDIVTPVYVPYTLANDRFGTGNAEGSNGIDSFQVTAAQGTDPTQLAQELKDYFAQNKFKSGLWQLESYDMASELGVINKVLSVITIAISVIAAISLLVGGVGVMNIMLVSVVERTKEIGIRMALGAKPRTIQRQFLVESVVICLIGGMIGILSGIFNGFLLSKVATVLVAAYASQVSDMLTVSVSPSVTAIIVSVVFSTLVGVVFGAYPARRAAGLVPIDALRFE